MYRSRREKKNFKVSWQQICRSIIEWIFTWFPKLCPTRQCAITKLFWALLGWDLNRTRSTYDNPSSARGRLHYHTTEAVRLFLVSRLQPLSFSSHIWPREMHLCMNCQWHRNTLYFAVKWCLGKGGQKRNERDMHITWRLNNQHTC